MLSSCVIILGLVYCKPITRFFFFRCTEKILKDCKMLAILALFLEPKWSKSHRITVYSLLTPNALYMYLI